MPNFTQECLDAFYGRIAEQETQVDRRALQDSLESLVKEKSITKRESKIFSEAYSEKALLKNNKQMYKGKANVPFQTRIGLLLTLGRKGLDQMKAYERQKCELREIVCAERWKLKANAKLEASMTEFDAFAYSFARALDQYGIDRFVESELGCYDIAFKALRVGNMKLRKIAEKKQGRKGKIERIISNNEKLLLTQNRMVSNFIDIMLDLHSLMREAYPKDEGP